MTQITEWTRPVSVFVLLLTCALANHNKWWSCNSECARCVRRVTPMEELILQFYPGLFSQTPPENVVYAQDFSGTAQSTVNSGTAEIPGTVTSSINRTNQRGLPGLDLETTSRRTQTHQMPLSGCCETVMEYMIPPNVTIGGQIYRVVHLRQAFQFIPVGRCRKGSTCEVGTCVEQHRAHWVLIYNSTLPAVGPPVSFSPIEVPSHCECLNVGRP